MSRSRIERPRSSSTSSRRKQPVSDSRRQVLDMLAAGQITVEVADRLIAAVEDRPSPAAAIGLAERPATAPRYLRVMANVEDEDEGPTKVNVRVPLQLLRAGVR